MNTQWELDEWAEVLLARRRRLKTRLLFSSLLTLLLAFLTRWEIALSWLAGYVILQQLEYQGLPQHRIAQLAKSARLRALVSSLSAVNAVAFGVFGLLILLVGPPHIFGLVITLIVALLTISISTSRGSRITFISTGLPYVTFLVVVLPVAVFLREGEPVRSAFLASGGFLGSVASVVAWREYERLLRSEAVARAAADRHRAEAEAATEAKSAFVAIVSHELRTPITALQAGATALEASSLSDRQRDQAQLINEAARMMRTLLNDLLDLSKLDAGAMTIEKIVFDVRALIRDAVEFWSAESRRKDLELRLTGSQNLPRWLYGDPTRLRQILNNLLSNAIKFTDTGTITLEIEVGEALELTVIDSGRGMTADQLARLFKPFGQADDSVARTHGGTGLGLSISRQLARLMDGDITVESNPDMGSAFRLQLPLFRAEPPGDNSSVNEAAGMHGLRILAVDDHEINRRAIALVLEPAQVVLSLAENATEALERLAKEPFDLVLMDVNMPELNGAEVARKVRAVQGPNQMTPILAFTGSADPADRVAYFEAGMNGCVAKPIDPREMLAAIGAVLNAPDSGTRAVAAGASGG